jgi:hypothetical protein
VNVNYNAAFAFSDKVYSKLLDLANTNKYTHNGLVEHTAKLSNGGISAIENTLIMLIDAGIITVKNNKCLLLVKKEKKRKELILEKLKQDQILAEVAHHIKNSSEESIQWIKNYSLFTNFAGVLAILNFLGFAKPDLQKRRYLLTEAGETLFKKNVGLTLEELRAKHKAQEERGEIAENFILAEELKKFKKHPKVNEVKKISDTNVSAGYDIQSFQTLDSVEIDKFIEVKSFLGAKNFYWSINEINVASKINNNYFLYIVDSSRVREKDYSHFEISNPYKYFGMKNFLEQIPKHEFRIEPQSFIFNLESIDF